ncbi:MAG: outer membrane protein assembly factor BamE [Bacteroidales bacterium]|jgi:hypothetical protein|nr:outer membrane protein assembly factor BamE [Bacteroidales bacterium]MDI9591426.1 outer membrane protein assembly factor BamE [Bacteroidota bacterium]NLH56917.1 outer membrane protein assembly factor BamE [Rikenellaceae bacterium]OQC35613.1 MAG: hypothetical protein BWX63_02321 [Bacteroidetes bacterium ADurb.Bin041]MBP7874150.1 outer membrane protein assembly factor BamE [Bacteroidales bacterium]
MNYKRNRIILLIVLFGILAFIFGVIFLHPNASKARNNVENSKRIIIGMNKAEVLKIMGTPDAKRLSFENSIDSMYYYEPPFAASEGIYIQFDNREIVNKIFPYE